MLNLARKHQKEYNLLNISSMSTKTNEKRIKGIKLDSTIWTLLCLLI